MKNYINFRIINNSISVQDAINKIEDNEFSESHDLADRVIELTPELEATIKNYCIQNNLL